MTDAPRRVVVDSGVLISGFISRGGVTAALLDAVLERRVIAVVSPQLVGELHSVLLREKFRRYATREEVDAYVVRLLAASDLVDDPAGIEPVSRDPDDDYLVALARSTRDVAAVVSGDNDLLSLHLPDVSVLTPRALIEGLTGEV